MVGDFSPGHGPVHLLSAGAAEIGFRWDPPALAWCRPDLPLLCNLAGPVQHFKAAVLDVWRNKVAADLCGREGFRRGPLLDVHQRLHHQTFTLLDLCVGSLEPKWPRSCCCGCCCGCFWKRR